MSSTTAVIGVGGLGHSLDYIGTRLKAMSMRLHAAGAVPIRFVYL